MSEEIRCLLELQHLDYMIKDWRNTEMRREFQKIGFQTAEDPVEMLLKKREELVKKISPVLYQMYQRIISRYNDWAIVPVLNGFCGGCFSKVPTELSGQRGAVYNCPNCGRFIYWD
ncbi:hypothetical protein KAX06_01770 [candidate division WOR-3 bacterium]|nr:hypothetical protein [candidate division WOR-3 bacterium]